MRIEENDGVLDGGGGVSQPRDAVTLLETEVLQLPDVEVGRRGSYMEALATHAVPIVDVLVRLQEAGVQRGDNATIARFASTRVYQTGDYEADWNSDLALAINDLGHAARLAIDVIGEEMGPNGTGFEMPILFRDVFPALQFPPALQHRIDSRRDQISAELESVTNSVHAGRHVPIPEYSPDFVLIVDRAVGNKLGTRLLNFRNTISIAAQLSPGQRVSR